MKKQAKTPVVKKVRLVREKETAIPEEEPVSDTLREKIMTHQGGLITNHYRLQ